MIPLIKTLIGDIKDHFKPLDDIGKNLAEYWNFFLNNELFAFLTCLILLTFFTFLYVVNLPKINENKNNN